MPVDTNPNPTSLATILEPILDEIGVDKRLDPPEQALLNYGSTTDPKNPDIEMGEEKKGAADGSHDG